MFLILDTHDLNTLYLHKQGREDTWVFFQATKGLQAEIFGKHRPAGTHS